MALWEFTTATSRGSGDQVVLGAWNANGGRAQLNNHLEVTQRENIITELLLRMHLTQTSQPAIRRHILKLLRREHGCTHFPRQAGDRRAWQPSIFFFPNSRGSYPPAIMLCMGSQLFELIQRYY